MLRIFEKYAIILLVLFTLETKAAYQDFTIFDETDEGNNVTVISAKVSWLALDRDETSHVSDSKGAAHFGTILEHKFECWRNNTTGVAVQYHWVIANTQKDSKSWVDDSDDWHGFDWEGTSNGNMYIVIGVDGSPTSDSWASPVDNTVYYVTVERDGTDFKAYIYTGSHGGTLKDTLTLTDNAQAYEYVFGLCSYDDATGDNYADGYTENLDLQEAAPTSIPIFMYHYMNH